ncbi:MAG: beta-lactamase family protein [Mucilaginibacter sp.]|nr:beta-lactamase family protein [Mucilaginibacter sp.]
MKLLKQSLFAFTTALLVLASCSSTPGDKDGSNLNPAEKSKPLDVKALLAYNPKNADKQIDAFMQHLHTAAGFNGNVLVAKKGKIVYQNAFGWANYPHQDSLTLNSQFELASISKTMTSTAILQLMERGKLRLTDSVQQFFPNFPYHGVTIRMLLTHRSGLPNYVYAIDDVFRKEHRDQKKGVTNQQMMDLLAQYKPARYNVPDKGYHYNNSNFMVLGSIIEKAAHVPYADYMMQNVFLPAGMKHTNVYSKATYDKIPTKVLGHDRNSWRYSVAQNYLDGPVGDKGIYSTVGDLFLFDRALRAGKLIKQATQDSAYTNRVPLKHGHFGYGYGWHLFEAPNQKVVYHTGWWHGFRHNFLRDMKEDVVIILLDNMANGSLLHLDDLFKMTGMPVVRAGAYGRGGEEEDEQAQAPTVEKKKHKKELVSKNSAVKKHKTHKH